jgi:hypothetical protein
MTITNMLENQQQTADNFLEQGDVAPVPKKNSEQFRLEVTSDKIYSVDPNDSFILGHTTLGRLRTSATFEADCSNNGNHGNWSFDGYDTGGHRLSFVALDGASIYATSSASITGVRSLSIFYRLADTDMKFLQLASGITIEIVNELPVFNGFTNVSYTLTELSAFWYHLYVTFDAITVNSISLGKIGTDYFIGDVDEFTLFDTTLSAQDISDIQNNNFYSNHSKYGNCKLWWSMDNPRLGDRKGTPVLVETIV